MCASCVWPELSPPRRWSCWSGLPVSITPCLCHEATGNAHSTRPSLQDGRNHMMNALQAILIAILQGATELFPVSSLGHAVVLPALMRSGIDQRSPEFLPFLVFLHLGTAIALLTYFWRDWWTLFLGVLGLGEPSMVPRSRRVFMLICIATLPAVIVGFLLEKYVRGLFGTPIVAAVFLIVNGFLLLFGERLRNRGTANSRH